MKLFRTVLFLSVTLMLLTVGVGLASAQNSWDGIPSNCEYEEGAFYRPDLLVRYDRFDGQVELADWNTGEVAQVLESGLDLPFFQLRGWSPDCRLVAVMTDRYNHASVVVWDTVDIRRVNTIDDLYLYHVTWSSNSRDLLLETHSGAYLWNPFDNHLRQLTDTFQCYGRSFVSYGDNMVWDYDRNEFIVVQQERTCRFQDGPVQIYDIGTGQLKDTIPGSSFSLSPDRSIILVSNYTLYDRNNGNTRQIRSRVYGDHYFSPDNRFLVGANRGLWIWDLSSESSAPTFKLNGMFNRIREVEFIESHIIETRDAFGNAQRWNLVTGEAMDE